jgi:hypothetical protein
MQYCIAININTISIPKLRTSPKLLRSDRQVRRWSTLYHSWTAISRRLEPSRAILILYRYYTNVISRNGCRRAPLRAPRCIRPPISSGAAQYSGIPRRQKKLESPVCPRRVRAMASQLSASEPVAAIPYRYHSSLDSLYRGQGKAPDYPQLPQRPPRASFCIAPKHGQRQPRNSDASLSLAEKMRIRSDISITARCKKTRGGLILIQYRYNTHTDMT